MTTLRQVAVDAREGLGVLAVSESAAVAAGLLHGPVLGYVVAALGVLNAAVADLLRRTRKSPGSGLTRD